MLLIEPSVPEKKTGSDIGIHKCRFQSLTPAFNYRYLVARQRQGLDLLQALEDICRHQCLAVDPGRIETGASLERVVVYSRQEVLDVSLAGTKVHILSAYQRQ